jgi:hypothetical protein
MNMYVRVSANDVCAACMLIVCVQLAAAYVLIGCLTRNTY